MVILPGGRWYLVVLLICISLLISYAEQVFTCFSFFLFLIARVKYSSWNWLRESPPSEFFSDYLPRDISYGQVPLTYSAPALVMIKCPESESHSVLSDSLGPHRLYSPWNSPGQNTGVGNLSLLQGIFPIQGLNPGLPHCRPLPSGKPRNTGVDSLSLLQWIFLIQESYRGLLHCRRILYQLSYQGSPECPEARVLKL